MIKRSILSLYVANTPLKCARRTLLRFPIWPSSSLSFPTGGNFIFLHLHFVCSQQCTGAESMPLQPSPKWLCPTRSPTSSLYIYMFICGHCDAQGFCPTRSPHPSSQFTHYVDAPPILHIRNRDQVRTSTSTKEPKKGGRYKYNYIYR